VTRLTLPPDFCRRVLGLPADTRATLAAVPGPGWEVTRGAFLGGGYGTTETRPLARCGADVSDRYAWWPANPADAVCAVLRIPPWDAHRRIYEACTRDEGDDGDDHAAAMEVIEGHVRGLRSTATEGTP
jgi:hypothetical protein